MVSRSLDEPDRLVVVAAVIVQHGQLLVVSKQAAPDVFYLPGGKPEPDEQPLEALARELAEELGVAPVGEPQLLAEVDAPAALEQVPMTMTVFQTDIDQVPQPAAELADLRWITGHEGIHLAPAVRDHVLPLLGRLGLVTPGTSPV